VADAPKSFHLSPAIHEYIVAHGTPPDEIEQWLISETKARVGDLSGMQIGSPFSAQLFAQVQAGDVEAHLQSQHVKEAENVIGRLSERAGNQADPPSL